MKLANDRFESEYAEVTTTNLVQIARLHFLFLVRPQLFGFTWECFCCSRNPQTLTADGGPLVSGQQQIDKIVFAIRH